jgi:hypothetical protein
VAKLMKEIKLVSLPKQRARGDTEGMEGWLRNQIETSD